MQKWIFIVCLFLKAVLCHASTLKVATFNILAPPWAWPDSYPETSLPYLDPEYRRDAIIDTLNGLKESTDIICLQETTPIEFGYIQEALSEFAGFQANHEPFYWSQYITDTPPWELNGTAIFIKRSSFEEITFCDIPLSSNGNHGSYAEAMHRDSRKLVRVISLHLDSDLGGNRKREMQAAVDFFGIANDAIDFIVGDYNSVPQRTGYTSLFESAGFFDVLYAIGNTKATQPIATGYLNTPIYDAIDHISVRNAMPVAGDVINHDLYTIYPIVPGYLHEDARMTANLQSIGSDHFPVWGIVAF